MAACTPARKSSGGKGSVAEQLVDNKIDVLMGGGASRYAQATDAGPSVLDYAKTTSGYRLVSNKSELDAVTSLDQGPVLGLFASGNMKPRYNPLTALPPPGAGGASTRCTPADRGSQPNLSSMTAKSIALLDNPKGFFLQAESAMIDKQEHASDICGAIGDVRELDETVQVALDYQSKNPDTLVIVTGDHAHSTQIVAGPTDGKQVATLNTADGDPMTVAYSTSDVGSDHTGAQIRVAASGPQAANVTGVIDQTDLFRTLLGRTPSKVSGPGQTAPSKPSVSVAAARSVDRDRLRRSGLQVAVAASGATKVRVALVRGNRTLASRALAAKGATVFLRANVTPGPVRVVATASGAGGTSSSSTTVRVTR
jgi:alkaline phosphatase